MLKLRQIDLPLKLNGKEFVAPIAHELGFNNHDMDEFWMIDLFKSLSLKSTDILMDIGANVGQSLLKWKSVFPEHGYIGIEPLPDCIQYLNLLCRVNGFNDCTIIEKAIFNKNTTSKLNLQFDDPTDRTASIIEQEKSFGHIEVETIDFPTLLTKFDVKPETIRVLKIDVEGAELEIIHNAKTFIDQYKPIIILEVLADKGYDWERVKKVSQLINDMSYEIKRIKKEKNRLKSLELITDITPPVQIIDSDYLLTYKNR